MFRFIQYDVMRVAIPVHVKRNLFRPYVNIDRKIEMICFQRGHISSFISFLCSPFHASGSCGTFRYFSSSQVQGWKQRDLPPPGTGRAFPVMGSGALLSLCFPSLYVCTTVLRPHPTAASYFWWRAIADNRIGSVPRSAHGWTITL